MGTICCGFIYKGLQGKLVLKTYSRCLKFRLPAMLVVQGRQNTDCIKSSSMHSYIYVSGAYDVVFCYTPEIQSWKEHNASFKEWLFSLLQHHRIYNFTSVKYAFILNSFKFNFIYYI